MSENPQVENQPKKQTNAEKIQNSVYSVQSLNVESDHAFEINYKGTPMLTTKERYTELALKAINYDKARDLYNEKNQRVRDLEEELKQNTEKRKEQASKLSEYEREITRLKSLVNGLGTQLEAEKKLSQNLGQRLAKFENNHKNMPSKKAFFSDDDKKNIMNMIIAGRAQNQKFTIRHLHEEIMRIGRQNGDKRIANVSYETVRATVAELKEKYPNVF